ncbi:GntR family transcriptional regulator [Streptomyces sp. NPDC052040]|uniref:GntR family transcriptional regulator n=1 Tax=Streptomyces sp. NPDC052040 TaxID=3365682 RepID=UPI0037CEC88D
MARSVPPDHPLPRPREEPLYGRIAAELLGELRDGGIPPGERLPGERQLAAHFRVSRETVRQALQSLRRAGLVATDRRDSHAVLPGTTAEHVPSLAFPVGARGTEPGRASVTWEVPSPAHAQELGLAPRRPTLVHRYSSAAADGSGARTAVTSFSAVAVAEVPELARYRDRADGRTSAELWRAYDWMRTAGLTLHHRDAIRPLPPTVRVTRRVHDQWDRPLEITDLLVEPPHEALVYEFTLPAA